MEIELSFGRGVLATGVWPALPKVPKFQAFFFSLYLPLPARPGLLIHYYRAPTRVLHHHYGMSTATVENDGRFRGRTVGEKFGGSSR